MVNFDTIIRSGTVVDGSGGRRYVADVGIAEGRIVRIGDLSGVTALKEIDAKGLIVAPGVIDPHTHYDAQVYWDPYCTNSGWHGVTSVVVGNCGFGFAPCREADREQFMRLMENTEQVPLDAMRAALPWNWETFPQWMASVRSIKKGVNIAAFLPLNSLMIWVMGYEAAKTRPATSAERAEMRRILHEAMDHGALGFGFSYLQETNSHKDVDGSPMITDVMHEDEALNLARVLAERGEGVIQAFVEAGPVAHREFVEKLALISGRPVLHTVAMVIEGQPERHRELLNWLDDTAKRGLNIYSQALCFRFMPISFVVRHFDLWQMEPIFNEFQHPGNGDTTDARVAKARDPDFRRRMKEEVARGLPNFGFDILEIRLISSPGSARFSAHRGKTFREIGEAENCSGVDAFLDVCAETRLDCELCLPRPHLDSEHAVELNMHPRVLPGTSDGGAHVKFVSGGQYGTDLISWLVRDEAKVSLEKMHHKLSAVPAQALGWTDRGQISVGSAADIMIYDLDRIGVATEYCETVHDLPNGDWRRVARAEGIRWILVNGESTFHDNVCIGSTPGKVLTASAVGSRVAAE